MPVSAIWPSASTTIRSACDAVVSRCATTMRGAPRRELLGGPVDLRLGGQVQSRGGLVQQQDRRVHQVGAGQRDQLALAGRQVAAALGYLVQEAAGQPGDHVDRADPAGRGLDLGVGGVRAGRRRSRPGPCPANRYGSCGTTPSCCR